MSQQLFDALISALLPWIAPIVGALATFVIAAISHRTALHRAARKAVADGRNDDDDDESAVQKATSTLASSMVGKLAGAAGRENAARFAMKKLRDSERPPSSPTG